MLTMKLGRLEDGILQFDAPAPAPSPRARASNAVAQEQEVPASPAAD
jgi:hypothetical protein